jgi:Protein of unknown function (DUF1552)
MKLPKNPLNRRTLLRGAGTAVALPLLEAMLPTGKTAFAQSVQSPPRFIGYFYSSGVIMDHYRLSKFGSLSQIPLSDTLSSFEDLKSEILVIDGLKGSRYGPGSADAQGTQSFLRGGYDQPSIDQIAHQAHMQSTEATRFGSLAVAVNDTCPGTGGGAPSAVCAISWETGTTIKPKDSDPRALFDKLFKGFDDSGREVAANRRAAKESVLSAVKDDARVLQQKLASEDRQILQKYLTSIEELELRIQGMEPGAVAGCHTPERPPAGPWSKFNYGPNYHQDKVIALMDLSVLALQCDMARYLTFMIENGGDARTYDFLGVSEGHVFLARAPYAHSFGGQKHVIERWLFSMAAYFVRGLKNATDFTGGNLLDSCLMAMSSCFSSGLLTNHNDMPFITAGSCNGYFKTGVSLPSQGNFTSVWMNVMDALGYPQPSIGSSLSGFNELRA